MKLRLFEFEDLPWFPRMIREGMTDYLRFIFTRLSLYDPVVPVLHEVLNHVKENVILDLCSGSGGPVEQVLAAYKSRYNITLSACLTDKFPNPDAFKSVSERVSSIRYILEPVDAMFVPVSIKGARTIFSGFHHFDPYQATMVIESAVSANAGIAIFDGGDKDWRVLLAILFHPLMMFFCTPFIGPFRFSRLFFTYIIPLIPLCTVWDGWVSIFRLYSPAQMEQLARSVNGKNYLWKSGKIKTRFGMKISFLTGFPQKEM